MFIWLFCFQEPSGRWAIQEVPNTEQVFKADLVLIALGFVGPEKVLSQQLGTKMVGLSTKMMPIHLQSVSLNLYVNHLLTSTCQRYLLVFC